MRFDSNITSKLNSFDFLSAEKKQVLLFLVAGSVNTLFGYFVFSLFIFLKFHYAIAMLFSTVAGIMFSFCTMSRVVFKVKKNILLIKFTLLYSILYVINLLIMKELNFFTHNLYLNGAMSITLMAVISFFSNKHFVFKDNT